MVDDEGGYSRAHANVEPTEVGRERPEEVAAEDETGVDGSAGVADGAGDREGGCVGRGEQDSGSKKRGKHVGCMWNFWDFVQWLRRSKEWKGGHWV